MKIRLRYRGFLSLLITVLIGLVFTVIGLVIIANTPETYNDWIVETLATLGGNESGEKNVFMIILILGIPILLLIDYLLKRHDSTPNKEKESRFIIKIEVVIAAASILYYVFFAEFLPLLFFAGLIAFLNYLINPKKQKEGLVLAIVCLFFLESIIATAHWFGFNKTFPEVLLYIIAAVLSGAVLWIDKKRPIITKLLMVAQTALPLNLLMFCCDRYIYQGEIMTVDTPLAARIFFYTLVVTGCLYGVWFTAKKWRKASSLTLDDVISLPTIIVVMGVFSLTVTSNVIIPTDLHHPAENILAYHQIVNQGQTPYTEFIPTSGLFSVLIGGVNELMGGTYASYNTTLTVLMMAFVVIVSILLSRHLCRFDCLMAAVLFTLPLYNRVWLILPSVLVLLLPKLIQRRQLWLGVWVWLIFLNGLYYPSLGIVFAIGTLPFAIGQIIKAWPGVKRSMKKWQFWLAWIITLSPMLIMVPLLLRMAKYISLQASQTTLADGMPIFGQAVWADFMPYLSEISRHLLYYSIRIILPAVMVWMMILFVIKIIKKIKLKEWIYHPSCLLLASAVFIPILSFSSTIIRNENNVILSRTGPVLVICFGFLFFIAIRRWSQSNIPQALLVGSVVGLLLIAGHSPLNTQPFEKNTYAHEVKDNFELTSEEMAQKYPRLGEGFVDRDTANTLGEVSTRLYKLLDYNPDLEFSGIGNMAIYYILDLPAIGNPATIATKGLGTSMAYIEAIDYKRPVVGLSLVTEDMVPLGRYYIYQWLMNNDSYVYADEYKAFLPLELFTQIYGDNIKIPDKSTIPINIFETGKIAGSVGESINSILPRLEKQDVDFSKTTVGMQDSLYSLDLTISGLSEKTDFLYLELNIDDISGVGDNIGKGWSATGSHSTVTVFWGEDDKYINAQLMHGKLLIPIGINPDWYTKNHDTIRIAIDGLEKPLKVEKIELYKLKSA